MDEVADDEAYDAGRTRPEQSTETVAATSRPTTVDYEPTGVESVDRVLADVAAVVDAPVDEHVQVFERAHEQLRRALDSQPGPTGSDRDA